MRVDNLGLSVMLNMLCGDDGETANAIKYAIGKKIKSVSIVVNDLHDGIRDDRFHIELEDDSKKLIIWDNGQSCCERRYMTCGDDLTGFGGAVILSIEVREGPTTEDEEYGDSHEIQFLVVKTSKGDITAETHNEHNGYYGGFSIKASLE